MGDFGTSIWVPDILMAYVANTAVPIEQMEDFKVLSYLRLFTNMVISFAFSPKELGLREMR